MSPENVKKNKATEGFETSLPRSHNDFFLHS